MKILIAIKPNSQLFTTSLKDGLDGIGCDVNIGIDEFWNYADKYNIINIHWPNALFNRWSPNSADIEKLTEHIGEIKKTAKIIYTRHNDTPHYSNDSNKLKCYEIIERNADLIIHMGNYGIDSFKQKLNNSLIKHSLVHLHIYPNNYDNTVSQIEARRKLNIREHKFVVLAFGAFRDREETDMVLTEFSAFKLKNKLLLAPRLNDYLFKNTPNALGIKNILKKLWSLKLRLGHVLSNGSVSDLDLSYYFAAADVVLIQRKKILNSGNIPMAFFFKKPVIGPNTGNVGELLTETQNMVFNPEIPGDLCRALNETFKKNRIELGELNYAYAIQKMNIQNVAKQYLEAFKSVLQ